jgi:hypothetical protein
VRIKHWAGYNAAVSQGEAEFQKLERLVWGLAYTLQKAGLDSEAANPRRAVQRE